MSELDINEMLRPDGIVPIDRATTQALVRECLQLRSALEWYGEQARLCRLLHSGGDAGRNALADDGGKRARAALSKAQGGENE